MKIVDVCAFYTPFGGGVKTYVERKLRIGAAQGQEIVIVAPGVRDHVERRPEGGRIIHIASPQLMVDRRYRYFADPGAVQAILDAEKPDMIEASSPWRTANIVAAWQGNAPRALIMHADPLATYAYRWFRRVAERETIDRSFDLYWRHLRRLGRRFDCVISANETLSARLRGGGVSGVNTIPMGVDPGVFSPSRRDPAIRQALLERCGLGPEATLLLGVGRHGPEKRWPLVIDACLMASQARPLGLVLIGDGRDRAAIVRHVGGNPHVHLLAPIKDRALLAGVMASGDALIHGCEAETFGLVAAEAVASGLPLIVPDEGGAADLATPAIGERYCSGDVGSAAAAISRLLARDQGALRVATHAAARRSLSIDGHFDRLFGLYGAVRDGVRSAA